MVFALGSVCSGLGFSDFGDFENFAFGLGCGDFGSFVPGWGSWVGVRQIFGEFCKIGYFRDLGGLFVAYCL